MKVTICDACGRRITGTPTTIGVVGDIDGETLDLHANCVSDAARLLDVLRSLARDIADRNPNALPGLRREQLAAGTLVSWLGGARRVLDAQAAVPTDDDTVDATSSTLDYAVVMHGGAGVGR